MTEIAAPDSSASTWRRRGDARTPAAWFARQDSRELALWGVLFAAALVVRVIGLGNRAVPPRREPGRVLLVPVPADRRLRVQPAAARPAALLPDGADVRAVRRLGLHRAPGAGADGAVDGPAVLAAAASCSAAARRSRAAVLFAFGPSYLYFGRFAREDIYVAAITLAPAGRHLALPRQPRTYHPALIGALPGRVVRDQGDDVHHGLRDGLVLPRSRSRSRTWRDAGRRRAR